MQALYYLVENRAPVANSTHDGNLVAVERQPVHILAGSLAVLSPAAIKPMTPRVSGLSSDASCVQLNSRHFRPYEVSATGIDTGLSIIGPTCYMCVLVLMFIALLFKPAQRPLTVIKVKNDFEDCFRALRTFFVYATESMK